MGSNTSETVTRDAVAIGKYIYNEVISHTDALEVSHSQRAVAVEQSSNARPVWETRPRVNRQERSSDRSKVPCASGWETDLSPDLNTIGEDTDGQSPAGGVSDGALQSLLPNIDSPINGQPSTNTASAAENAEDDQSPQPTSRLEAVLAPKHLRKHEVCTQGGKSRSRANRSVRRRPSRSNRAWNRKVHRVARKGVAKLRYQRRRESEVAGVPPSDGEGTEVEAQEPQGSASEEAMIDSNAEADGRMVGLEADDLLVALMAGLRISEQTAESMEIDDDDLLAGLMAGLRISEQTAESMEVEDEDDVLVALMAGLRISEQTAESMEIDDDDLLAGLMAGLRISKKTARSIEAGEPMDLVSEEDAGDVDEVMVGSDVDGEMEVDG